MPGSFLMSRRSWYKSDPKRLIGLMPYVHTGFVVMGVLLTIAVPVASLFIFRHLDPIVCPDIVPCTSACMIQADPDIAGIGVGDHTIKQVLCRVS